MTSPSTQPQPTSDAPHEAMDALLARRTAREMASVTRVLFGVTAPPTSALPESRFSDAPVHPSQRPVPVTSVPVLRGIPAPQPVPQPVPQPDPLPVASSAPTQVPPVPPASLPVPEVPVLSSVPASEGFVAEPARETSRRPAGPSLELLQEISFLEE